MKTSNSYPFILIGPRDGEKTDFLLACALAHAASLGAPGGDNRNALLLCLHQLVVDQVRICLEKALPDTGGIGINCLSYFQLMREAGYQGPPRTSVPPSFLRDPANRAKLRQLIDERYGLVLFDQIFEAIRYFPELIETLPKATRWAGALTSPAKPSEDFRTALAHLSAGIPNLALRKTRARPRKYDSRNFLRYTDLLAASYRIENWIESSDHQSSEATIRAWPLLIVLHRSLWTHRRRIASDLTDYLRSRGFDVFDGLSEKQTLADKAPTIAIVTEFEARGLASKYSLVLHNRPEELARSEFLSGEQELEGGSYSSDQWDIRRLTRHEMRLWELKEASQKIFLHKGHRVFLVDFCASGPLNEWFVEIKFGAATHQVKPDDLYLVEQRKPED